MGVHDPTIHVPGIFSVYLSRSRKLMMGWPGDSSKGSRSFEEPKGIFCTF
jgi:hypothetical protein